MIFYFSGTGNSQMVAQMIGQHLQDKTISIVNVLKHGWELSEWLKENEPLILIFPIYAWAPPPIVLEFIEKMTVGSIGANHPISLIITCAKTQGNTINIIQNILQRNGQTITNAYLLRMPNSDTIFGRVESTTIRAQKLSQSKHLIRMISERLRENRQGDFWVKKERFALVKTTFGTFVIKRLRKETRFFAANNDCISCKICEKICPEKCIKVKQKPVWEGKCLHCLACLNFCPKSAIQYGKQMSRKARYTNPMVSWYELNQEKDFKEDVSSDYTFK